MRSYFAGYGVFYGKGADQADCVLHIGLLVRFCRLSLWTLFNVINSSLMAVCSPSMYPWSSCVKYS